MSTVDMVVQENFGQFNISNPVMPPDRFELADDLYVGKIDHATSKIILDFGDPKGYNIVTPTRQWGYFYAFVRNVAEPADIYRWDTDQRLQTTIALSRLIRPTSISFRNAGRIQYNDDGTAKHAFPAWLQGIDPDAWLPPEENYRDWLIKEELEELKLLSEQMSRAKLAVRISRALWYHEYAARTYYGEVRWVLVCTALESLLNTHVYNSGAQFRIRVPQLAGEIGVAMSDDHAKKAWGMRSHLSHGGATGQLKTDEEEIYKKLEKILREALKKSILNDGFAALFADEDAVRLRWPVIVNGRSI
jgi:hypothetical protein